MAYNGWIDSHCHLCTLEDPMHELELAEQAGVDGFVTIALNRKELAFSEEILNPNVLTFAGVHPSYSKTQNRFIQELPELIDSHIIEGIGEIGLDKRNRDIIWQREILLEQLDIAEQYNIPVSMHCVKMYYELYKLIKDNFPCIRGAIHGFNGSVEIIEEFSKLDIAFGINPGILANPNLSDIVNLLIERNKLLLESDAPNTHNSNFAMKTEGLQLLPYFATEISSQTGVELSKLKEAQLNSFKEFIAF